MFNQDLKIKQATFAISLILMKCGQSSVFRVAYNDGRLKMILSVPGDENLICSSMGRSIDN